ncbi:MAG: hypothetical protein EXQ70_10635 [Solirubrobacterales bacterium]|nr:hypothetical protein [Solirubrobacterales bacterium]
MALALAALAGLRPPGVELARAIAERMVCAVRLEDPCRSDPVLAAQYGAELASLIRDNAPQITYERGMSALPVDFRRCRSDACAEGAGLGRVARSLAGRRVAAFVHVIDCRDAGAASEHGYDCSGERSGTLFIQYWLYYPGSATAEGSLAPGAVRSASAALGRSSFHQDDWEGYQVRIGPDGRVDARASSHNGYNGSPGIADWASDIGSRDATQVAEAAGLRRPGGWTRSRGTLYVSGGSHAGHATEASLRRELSRLLASGAMALEDRDRRGPFAARDRRQARDRLARRLDRSLFGPGSRVTPRGALTLIPIEPLALSEAATRFAISPPWRKRVYRDPEYSGTD